MNAGVLLVATGEKYVNEAKPLVKSIRRFMPDIPIHVVTDLQTDIPEGLFDSIDRADIDLSDLDSKHRGFMFRDIALTRTPFDYTVHVDTDTLLGAPVYDVFHGLKQRFELMVAAAPAKVGKFGDDSIPFEEQEDSSFMVIPRINCGFISYRKSIVESGFFDKWVKMYRDGIPAAIRRGRTKFSDQSLFRRLLWESDINFQIMPPEYNLRTGAPQYLDGPVRIAHGRPPMGRENCMNFINSFTGRRLYVPYLELVHQVEGEKARKNQWHRSSYKDWEQSQLEAA